MPPLVKITFLNYGYRSQRRIELDPTEIDITKDIDLSEGVRSVAERNELDGVIVDSATPLIFKGEARKLLSDLFDRHELYAYCELNVYLRDRVDWKTYKLVESFEVNFPTVEFNDQYKIVTVELQNITLKDFINSNSQTKYDIPVWEIADDFKWRYERLALEYTRNFNLVAEEMEVKYDYVYPENLIYLRQASGGSTTRQNIVTFKDQPEMPGVSIRQLIDNNDLYFMKILDNVRGTVTVNFTISFNYSIEGDIPQGTDNFHTEFYLLEVRPGENDVRPQLIKVITENKDTATATISVEGNAGSRFVLSLRTYKRRDIAGDYRIKLTIFNTDATLTSTFVTRTPFPLELDVIKPESLLNALLKRMIGHDNFSSSIQWFNRPSLGHFMLCAAESIRDLPEAYLHTSFSEFRRWMHSLGYTMDFPEYNTLIFREAASQFDKNKKSITIREGQCGNFRRAGNNEYAYTGVKVGYNLPEYNSDNGRFEANGLFNYFTGLVMPQMHILDLTSPYRADSVGIEMLSWERPDEGQQNKDNQSDNDVFCVCLERGGYGYNTLMNLYMGTENQDIKLFNAYLNPYFLIEYNKKRLGISTDLLEFASTDSNRQAYFSDEALQMYGNKALPERLFSPYAYSIDAIYISELFDPGWRNGVITFEFDGKTYYGFLKETDRLVNRESFSSVHMYAIRD